LADKLKDGRISKAIFAATEREDVSKRTVSGG
jgi:hypothetical protein